MNDKIKDARKTNFFMVDNCVFDTGLGPYSISVYFYILRRAGNKDKAFPSISNIEKATKISRPKVIESIKELIKKKLIKKQTIKLESGNFARNEYYLVDCAMWEQEVNSKQDLSGVVNEIDQGSKQDLSGVVNEIDSINTHINNTHKEYNDEAEASARKVSCKLKDSLYQEIIDFFYNKNRDGMKDYQRQGRAVKNIIKRAEKYYPDFKQRDSLRAIISKLWELKNKGTQFWKTQPFAPSTLDSLRIWDLVIEQVKKPNEDKEDIMRMLEKAQGFKK